jgi:putative SOS response-associated peptidase YedK
MCGRFYLTAIPAEIRKQFKIQKVPSRPRYNIVSDAKIGAVGVADGRGETRVYNRLHMSNIAHTG